MAETEQAAPEPKTPALAAPEPRKAGPEVIAAYTVSGDARYSWPGPERPL